MSAPSAEGGGGSASKFGNFTPRAERVLGLAREEAVRLNHNFVSTEHLLLGLVRLGQGVAVTVLRRQGLDLDAARCELEKQVGAGSKREPLGPFAHTARVKKVLAMASNEARALHHTYVGMEHILLGLLREGDGGAARVLNSLGVDSEKARQEILKELDPNSSAGSVATGPAEAPQNAAPEKLQKGAVDTSKRYDVYCAERNEEVVVCRNALFKSRKDLLRKDWRDTFSSFLELEQADGKTVFVAEFSVIKFCEPGVTPNCEKISGEEPGI